MHHRFFYCRFKYLKIKSQTDRMKIVLDISVRKEDGKNNNNKNSRANQVMPRWCMKICFENIVKNKSALSVLHSKHSVWKK